MNYSYPALIKMAEKKYEELDRLDQGVIKYLKIALDDMFNMSDAVITSLHELFKNFSRNGISKYPSENVALLFQKINSVEERLAEVPELPRDTELLILSGSTKYSVNEFVDTFELILNTESVI